MSVNGEHVTRAELTATVEPMKSDITEIKADVKKLLARDAGQQALASFKSRTVALGMTLFSGVVGAVLALIFQ